MEEPGLSQDFENPGVQGEGRLHPNTLLLLPEFRVEWSQVTKAWPLTQLLLAGPATAGAGYQEERGTCGAPFPAGCVCA